MIRTVDHSEFEGGIAWAGNYANGLRTNWGLAMYVRTIIREPVLGVHFVGG